MPSPFAVQITLTDDERAVLEAWTSRRKTAQALALRARIVLAAAGQLTNREIAALEGVSPPTVTKWRNRFAERRLEGLMDEPRPGRPRTISDEQVEEVVIRTLESSPTNATHWSTRSMARETGIAPDSVMRIWHAFGLQPHRQERFKLSKDPQLIEKVHDICGLYLNPPERAVVLAVDEKSQIQALDRTAPTFPMLPGSPERATHDYERNGTTSLYAALDVQSGEVIGSLHQRHRAVEFLKFLKTIEKTIPPELGIHLVLDNASSHKTPTVRRWLAQHPRFVLHFTPTSSSWINLVERWFGELTAKLLRRGQHRSVRQLNAEIRDWIDTWNENPRPYVWVKTAEQILDSIKRYCQRINRTGHYDDSTSYEITGSPEDSLLPVEELSGVSAWDFLVTHVPYAPPVQLFLSGSSPELGGWRPDQAIPLQHLNDRVTPETWGTTFVTLERDPSARVEYKYLWVSEPGGPPVWEEGSNRLVPRALAGHGYTQRYREAREQWRRTDDN